MINAEPTTCPSEPRGNLVSNQQHASARADFAYRPQITVWRHHYAPNTQNWLDEKSGDILGA